MREPSGLFTEKNKAPEHSPGALKDKIFPCCQSIFENRRFQQSAGDELTVGYLIEAELCGTRP